MPKINPPEQAEGFAARYAGISVTRNPYHPASVFGYDWRDGWYKADKKIKDDKPNFKSWRYEIQFGPEGQIAYAWVFDGDSNMVCTTEIHHAKKIIDAVNILSTPPAQNDCPHKCHMPGDCDGSCTHPESIPATGMTEWPPMKKALWDVVTAAELNKPGRYNNAYALTEKLFAAIYAVRFPGSKDI